MGQMGAVGGDLCVGEEFGKGKMEGRVWGGVRRRCGQEEGRYGVYGVEKTLRRVER